MYEKFKEVQRRLYNKITSPERTNSLFVVKERLYLVLVRNRVNLTKQKSVINSRGLYINIPITDNDLRLVLRWG